MLRWFLFPSISTAFSLHVIGDWGRRGQFSQKIIAEHIRTMPHDAVISVGDNFYPDGLQTNTDDQIHESWLDIYMPERPWYVALGNHDHHGNVSAQISIDNPYWNMPYNVYDFTIGRHTFVVCDSTIFDDLQFQTVDRLLAAAVSDGQHTWIVTHHPIVSAGWHHADIGRKYQDDLIGLYRQYNVNAIISGHDHNLQYLEWHGVRQIISGAGSSAYHVQHPQKGLFFFESNPGFVNMDFLEEKVVVTFFGETSDLYTLELPYQKDGF